MATSWVTKGNLTGPQGPAGADGGTTAHAIRHATGGADPLDPATIGAALTGHTHPPSAVPAPPRAATAGGTYSADGTEPGDIDLTCTGNTVITPTGTPNGRMLLVRALASGAARTPAVATSVLLADKVTSRSLTVSQGRVGMFGLAYSALRGGWMLLATDVI